MILLFASRTVTVSVEVEPEATEVTEAEIDDCAREIGPGFTVTVGKVDDKLEPSIEALKVVAVPAAIPVKVAVYVPLLLSVTTDIAPVELPPEFEKLTTRPPVAC